jgi:hypothetical protein
MSESWRVTIGGVPGGRAIRLHIGDFTVLLPPLEAHELGSALHAASGLDAEPMRVWPNPDWHPDGRSADASHRDEASEQDEEQP